MRLLWQSISYFSRFQLFLLHFLILSVLQTLLFWLLIQEYSSDGSQKVIMTSILLSGASMGKSVISSVFIGDMNRGIDKIVAFEAPFSLYYWSLRIIASFMSGCLVVLINGGLFYMLGFIEMSSLIVWAPLVIIYGIIIGLCGCFLSWRYDNPYFWSNIFGSLMVILSGTIGAISLYPRWLIWFSYLFPFARTMEVVHVGKGNIMTDILIAVIWLCVSMSIYLYQIKRLSKDT